MSKFGNKWQSASTRTFDRRLKAAELELKEENKAIQAKAEQNVAKKVEELELEIMGVMERKVILSKIARQQIPLKKAMVVGKDIMEIEVVPDWMDVKNAIAELNKMDGEYAPVKLAPTKVDGTDLPPAPPTILIGQAPPDYPSHENQVDAGK